MLHLPGFIIGLCLLIIGLLIYKFAHRIPSNPFLGFRVGYAYLSRGLWIRLNRIAGLTFSIIGLVLTILSFIIINDVVMAITLTLTIIVSFTFLIIYSSKITETELFKIPEHREGDYRVIKSIPPTTFHLILTLAPYIGLPITTLFNTVLLYLLL